MKNMSYNNKGSACYAPSEKKSLSNRSARNQSLSLQLNSGSSFTRTIESPTNKKVASFGLLKITDFKPTTSKNSVCTRKPSMTNISIKINDNLRISPAVMIHEKNEVIEKLPLSSERASKVFGKNLTNYEKIEILNFREIFYVGSDQKSEISAFDDESHNLVVYENDHVAYRYQIKRILGLGSFSQVYEAYDWKSRTNVAIKILRNKEKYKKQAEKEISFLTFTKEKARNLPFPEMLCSFKFREHICIVFKLLGQQLSSELHSPSDVIRFTVDILACLQFLHQHKIVHCDVKPSNILLSSHKIAHLIDLGTATYVSEQVYKYVQSRNYRAPEVILRFNYTTKADMWGLGCVLFEAVTGKVLFDGKDEAEVLERIVGRIGKPPKMWSKSFEKVWNGKGCGVELREEVEGFHPVLREIIVGCVQWNPKNRISAEEALGLLKQ